MKSQIILMFLIVSSFSFAQKGKILAGEFKNLKEVEKYSLVFDYTDFKIANYSTEEDFLREIVRIKENKEIGSGEEYQRNWFLNRPNIYEPEFIKSFNKYFKKGKVMISKAFVNSEHTIKVKVIKMYIGYYVDASIKETKLDAIISVYKTELPSDVLLLFEVNGMMGKYKGKKNIFSEMELKIKGLDYYSVERIEQLYSILGKYFAKQLRMGIK